MTQQSLSLESSLLPPNVPEHSDVFPPSSPPSLTDTVLSPHSTLLLYKGIFLFLIHQPTVATSPLGAPRGEQPPLRFTPTPCGQIPGGGTAPGLSPDSAPGMDGRVAGSQVGRRAQRSGLGSPTVRREGAEREARRGCAAGRGGRSPEELRGERQVGRLRGMERGVPAEPSGWWEAVAGAAGGRRARSGRVRAEKRGEDWGGRPGGAPGCRSGSWCLLSSDSFCAFQMKARS